jgi:hypothetical protein
MNKSLTDAIARIGAAGGPADLFDADASKAKAKYRRLAQTVHPDHVPPEAMDEAKTAFAKLKALYDEYQRADTATPTGASTVLATARRTYVLGPRIAVGNIANLYRAQFHDGTAHDVVAKIVRDPRNNDLAENEASVLKRMRDADADDLRKPYHSELLDSFRYRDSTTGAERQVNVLTPLQGFYSLAQVKAAYPEGIGWRDFTWMWKRLLIAIGHAHANEVVHGAVIPEHVLIHPEMHGFCLVDWSYSVSHGEPLKAIVGAREGLYPNDVLHGEPTSTATDIFMASKTMETLFSADVPPKFRAFVRGTTVARAYDTWALLREMNDLAGPRVFTPFSMPVEASL